MKDKVAFVILHYMTIEMTKKCVESILTNITYEKYKIIIIDNGSPNKSGEELKKIYQNNENIICICLSENRGFSVGNNIGYAYAKKRLKADYIIVINNDVLITQKDFIQILIREYMETSYYVMGPDIVGLDGIHQSPQRNHVITKREAQKWLLKRKIFTRYLQIHKLLNLSLNFRVYQKYKASQVNMKRAYQYKSKQESVELQGSCFIFSPAFIEESEFAFDELTFLYGEEMLLAIRCSKNNWKMLYNPDIQVLHIEHYTTKSISNEELDRDISYSKYHIKAIRAIIQRLAKC